MRSIGRTENGGYIIEMSEEERRVLILLQMSLEGQDLRGWRDNWPEYKLDVPLGDAFLIINNWVRMRCDLDHLTRSLDRFKKLLLTPKDQVWKEDESCQNAQ